MDHTVKNIEFPALNYSFDALEPHIDAQTMELHYTKHHKAYFTKLKAAAEGTAIEETDFEDVLKNISKYPAAVRNNGGGHWNHSMFWTIMSKNGGGNPKGILAEAIERDLESFDALKEAFESAAASRFGSGWAWLLVNSEGKLQISSTPNQDNPLMDVAAIKGQPIMGLDVWEHAYYLNYQNRRPDYISAFWNIIDWNEVEHNYEKAISTL